MNAPCCRFCSNCLTFRCDPADRFTGMLCADSRCNHHRLDHRSLDELGRRNLTENPVCSPKCTPYSLRVKSNFRAYIAAACYPGDGTVTMQLPDGSDRVVKQPNRRFACMLSGELGDNDQVRVLNLMPLNSTDQQIEAANILRFELCSTYNCLLVADQIKRAYQRLDISFVPASNNTYVMKIWTPVGLHSSHKYRGDVRGIPLWDNTSGQVSSKLIGEFEGQLLFVGANELFTQALVYQELFAFRQARERRWIGRDEKPSESAIMALFSMLQRQPDGIHVRI